MVTALKDADAPSLDRIDQPVLLVDAARPHAASKMLEGLGLSRAGIRRPADFLDKL
jgi:hypothetical protein